MKGKTETEIRGQSRRHRVRFAECVGQINVNEVAPGEQISLQISGSSRGLGNGYIVEKIHVHGYFSVLM